MKNALTVIVCVFAMVLCSFQSVQPRHGIELLLENHGYVLTAQGPSLDQMTKTETSTIIAEPPASAPATPFEVNVSWQTASGATVTLRWTRAPGESIQTFDDRISSEYARMQRLFPPAPVPHQ